MPVAAILSLDRDRDRERRSGGEQQTQPNLLHRIQLLTPTAFYRQLERRCGRFALSGC